MGIIVVLGKESKSYSQTRLFVHNLQKAGYFSPTLCEKPA